VKVYRSYLAPVSHAVGHKVSHTEGADG
jgi:hypothetical protein